MNAGAMAAQSGLTWFLHADTKVPANAEVVLTAMQSAENGWGFFCIRLSGAHWWCRLVERFINLRSSLSRIGTGDQGLYCNKQVFASAGGFSALQLMEDVEICARLKRFGAPGIIRSQVLTTSSRRWQQGGVVSTVLLMWRIRFFWWLGVNHRLLAQLYR